MRVESETRALPFWKKGLAVLGGLFVLGMVGMGVSAGYERYNAPIPLAVNRADFDIYDNRFFNEYMTLQTELDLSRPQKKQLAAIYTAFLNERGPSQNRDKSLLTRLMQESAGHQKLHEDVRAMLTPEQAVEFDEMRRERLEQFGSAARAYIAEHGIPSFAGFDWNRTRDMLNDAAERLNTDTPAAP